MKKNAYRLRAACLAALVFACATAQAHGLWFAQRGGDIALVYGEGADDLDTAKRLPLIRHFSAYDATGMAVTSALQPVGKLALADLAAAPAVLAAVLDNGIWTKTTDGRWHKAPKNAVAAAAHSSHNLKYAVHLLDPAASAQLPALAAQTLQLIPLTAIPATRGQPLRLRVLFNGRPQGGVRIVADFVNDPNAAPLISNDDGVVEVPVRNQGLNVIAAEFEAPPVDARLTDAVEHVATLSFRLRHAGE